MTEKSKMTEEELEEILKLISNLSRKEWLFLRQAVNAYFDKKAKEIELDSNFVDELVNEGHNLEDVIKDITDLARINVLKRLEETNDKGIRIEYKDKKY